MTGKLTSRSFWELDPASRHMCFPLDGRCASAAGTPGHRPAIRFDVLSDLARERATLTSCDEKRNHCTRRTGRGLGQNRGSQEADERLADGRRNARGENAPRTDLRKGNEPVYES
jgi:hypothetical protein